MGAPAGELAPDRRRAAAGVDHDHVAGAGPVDCLDRLRPVAVPRDHGHGRGRRPSSSGGEGAASIPCIAPCRCIASERFGEETLANAVADVRAGVPRKCSLVDLRLRVDRAADRFGRRLDVRALRDRPADDEDLRPGRVALATVSEVSPPATATGIGDAFANLSSTSNGVRPAICMSMPMCQQTAAAPSSATRFVRATGSDDVQEVDDDLGPVLVAAPDRFGDRVVVGGAEDRDKVGAGLGRDLDLERAGVHHLHVGDDPVRRGTPSSGPGPRRAPRS